MQNAADSSSTSLSTLKAPVGLSGSSEWLYSPGVPEAATWIKSSSPTFDGKGEVIYIPFVYILLLDCYFKELANKKKSIPWYSL